MAQKCAEKRRRRDTNGHALTYTHRNQGADHSKVRTQRSGPRWLSEYAGKPKVLGDLLEIFPPRHPTHTGGTQHTTQRYKRNRYKNCFRCDCRGEKRGLTPPDTTPTALHVFVINCAKRSSSKLKSSLCVPSMLRLNRHSKAQKRPDRARMKEIRLQFVQVRNFGRNAR